MYRKGLVSVTTHKIIHTISFLFQNNVDSACDKIIIYRFFFIYIKVRRKLQYKANRVNVIEIFKIID
jgi:hypothetical protein